jgi:hypothetical protein
MLYCVFQPRLRPGRANAVVATDTCWRVVSLTSTSRRSSPKRENKLLKCYNKLVSLSLLSCLKQKKMWINYFCGILCCLLLVFFLSSSTSHFATFFFFLLVNVLSLSSSLHPLSLFPSVCHCCNHVCFFVSLFMCIMHIQTHIFTSVWVKTHQYQETNLNIKK